MRTRTNALAVAAVFLVAAALRLYNLDELPGEWYSDMSVVDEYVSSILDLRWPLGFAASAGPLYHYLIAPFIALLDHTYLSYKLASVAVSFLAIAASMLLAYELGDLRLSYLTGFISGVSSWLLVFSRLGNSQIVIPALSALSAYFLIRFTRSHRKRFAIFGAIVSALGFYTYPQTFILPFLFLFFLAISALGRRPWPLHHLRASLLIILGLAVPFVAIAIYQRDNFRDGYIGVKFFGAGALPLSEVILAFAENLLNSALMLHVRGDFVFRSNPPYLPHLDPLSGALFILGIIALFRARGRLLGFLLAVVLLLVVPGSWPYLPSGEVPSASRAIAVTPFVYLLVANGLLWLYDLGKRGRQTSLALAAKLPQTALVLLLGALLILNTHRYFVTYAWNLPDHNVAFGRIIAQEIDALPRDAKVYVGGIHWGEWGQPEYDGILKQMRLPRQVSFLSPEEFDCEQYRGTPTPSYFFWDPGDEAEGFARLRECLPGGQVEKREGDFGTVVYLLYRIDERG